MLLRYYDAYVGIARRAGAGLQLETPTWRASADWGDRIGWSAADLRRVNRDAVTMLAWLRDRAGLDPLLVSGCLGPRGDGYVAGEEVDPDEAVAYHAPQIEAFAGAGLAGTIPGAHVVVLPAGHGPWLGEPQRTAAAVRDLVCGPA